MIEAEASPSMGEEGTTRGRVRRGRAVTIVAICPRKKLPLLSRLPPWMSLMTINLPTWLFEIGVQAMRDEQACVRGSKSSVRYGKEV